MVLSYTGKPRGPDTPAYQAYARAWGALFFTDVRGFVERLTPGLEVHAKAVLARDKTPLPYTLFGLLWFPAVVIAALWRVLRRGRWRSPTGGAVLLSLHAVALTLVVPILTDGIEANRMRFPTGALFVLVLLGLVARVQRSSSSAPSSRTSSEGAS